MLGSLKKPTGSRSDLGPVQAAVGAAGEGASNGARAAARWMQQLWAQQTNPSANVDGLDQKCPIDSNASIVW
jgi:hypothetical protein